MQAGNKNCYYGLLIEDELVKFTLNVNNATESLMINKFIESCTGNANLLNFH